MARKFANFIVAEFNVRLLTKRGHNMLMNDLNRFAARRHRFKIFPKHFRSVPETRAGVGGYQYKQRDRKWQKYKKVAKGHNKPWVFSGRAEQTAKAAARTTATRSSWAFRTHVPYKVKTDQRRELEVVSRREIRELERKYESLYPKMAGQPKYQQFIKKRTR